MGSVCRSGRAVRADDGIIQQKDGDESIASLFCLFIPAKGVTVNIPMAKSSRNIYVADFERGGKIETTLCPVGTAETRRILSLPVEGARAGLRTTLKWNA
jgi:hypothetical protein